MCSGRACGRSDRDRSDAVSTSWSRQRTWYTIVAMTARARRPMRVTPSHSDVGAGYPSAAGRDPVRAVYEQAAGLLASAGALRAAAHASGTTAALGPTLACVEASLDALAGVAEELRNQAVQPPPEAGAVRPTTGSAGLGEVEQRFRQLIDALEHARAACAYARVAVGPIQSCARHTR
jgi:hypothetical protein